MYRTSKQSLILVLIACFAITIWAFAFKAQRNSTKTNTVTVTGCLQQGDEPNEYSLTADDGKLYDLRSSSVKLSDHIGHKVTVTGKLKAEEKDEEQTKESKEKKEGGKKEVGDIQVGNLKMVSNSCQ